MDLSLGTWRSGKGPESPLLQDQLPSLCGDGSECGSHVREHGLHQMPLLLVGTPPPVRARLCWGTQLLCAHLSSVFRKLLSLWMQSSRWKHLIKALSHGEVGRLGNEIIAKEVWGLATGCPAGRGVCVTHPCLHYPLPYLLMYGNQVPIQVPSLSY